MSDFFPPVHWTNLLIIPGMLIGFVVHELAHAFAAYYLGDYSQVEKGKITLNPFRHISWFGTFAFLLFGIGWTKSLQVDPRRFKRRHLDTCLVAIVGPIASFTLFLIGLLLTLTIAAVMVYGSGVSTDEVLLLLLPSQGSLPETLNLQAIAMALTTYIAVANFWLALTSLIPLPGLDSFIAIVSLVAFFREKEKPNQAKAAVDGRRKAGNALAPLSQYQRRNSLADIHFKIGTEYHEANKFDDAIARYRQAIDSDKRFGPAYVNLGLAYLGKGKRREAIQAFRGAVQYSDDQKSQQEAWYQLHQLSEVSPVATDANDNMNKMGALPWTDTKPRPNWISLSVGTGLFLVCGVAVYGYVFTNLIHMLRT